MTSRPTGHPAATTLTIVQVAERLHISRSSVYRLIALRELEVVDVSLSGKRPRLRVTEKALAEFLERRKIPAQRRR